MTTKLRAASFQDGAVTTAKIAASAITSAKIADGAVDSDAIGSSAIPANKLNIGQIGGRRNLIINGAMQIAQRGTSQASINSAGYYTVDRFKINTNDAGVWTMSQETLSSSDTPFTEGFTKALKLDCTTSATPASNGTLQVQYSMEGQDLQQLSSGTSSAKTLVLSFWIKATKTGTNVLGGYQDDGGKAFGLTYTINSSNTWEYKTITIPANTADAITNDATRGRIVTWYFSAGTNRTTGTLRSTWTAYDVADEAVGQVNHADNTSNNIHITGVQLEVGSQATPFEHRSLGDEQNLCWRYYYKTNQGNHMLKTTSTGNSGDYYWYYYLPIPMRTSPTCTVDGGSDNYNHTASPSIMVRGSLNMANINYTKTGTASNAYFTMDGITADAEL